jgi:hypothetical protein
MDEPEYRIMESNSEALAAIDSLHALTTKELRVFDYSAASLRERGMGRPARIEQLRAMLLASRNASVRIVLHETNGAEAELPRLVSLMGMHAAQLKIQRSVGIAREAKDVLLIGDDLHCWRKPHVTHPRSIINLNDGNAAKPFIDRFEEIWACTEVVPIGSATGL